MHKTPPSNTDREAIRREMLVAKHNAVQISMPPRATSSVEPGNEINRSNMETANYQDDDKEDRNDSLQIKSPVANEGNIDDIYVGKPPPDEG